MLKRAKTLFNHSADRVGEKADSIQKSLSPYQAPSADSAGGYTDYDQPTSHTAKVLKDIKDQMRKGIPLIDIKGVSGVLDAIRHTNEIDDRKLLLENALMLMSKLPNGSLKTKLQTGAVEILYHDLAHPPSTYLGKQHIWRTPDGSYNNVNHPNLGKAGNNYSRSVQQQHPLPPSQLPDPGLLFDSLLKREGYVKHPGGLSAMMFSFAVLVIHTCFRTSHKDWSVNQTSSYVDLAPLYGWSDETQASVRTFNGRGYLKNDAFAEDRLLFLPPAASVVLVLLNRNHNYICDKLLSHNERGTFNANLGDLNEEELQAQDNELFNVARLINCGWFGNIVFSDYFSAILGLCRFGSNWFLNPFEEVRKQDHTLLERGQGNAVTVEFNLLYRWHSTLSRNDEKYITSVFDKVFKGKPHEEIDMEDYRHAMSEIQDTIRVDVAARTFGDLKRGEDGKFNDAELGKILIEAICEPAGAFKARGTPEVLRIVEIMTIKQSRTWGVCNLNEFRKFLGLRPFKTFEEWNSRQEIADIAKRVYGDIENLELHVGLQAEEAKPLIPGAGLCPGYTVSRAILADAIALTRGDRFFTTDFTPYNLTSWGYTDCNRDDNNPAFGGMLGRLFLRTLPNEFTHNNVHTWFPLMCPDFMETHLKTLDLASKYSFDVPKIETPTVPVTTYSHVDAALKSENFSTTYSERAKSLGLGKSFYIAAPDLVAAQKLHQEVLKAAVGSPESLQKHADEMAKVTKELIDERSFTIVGKNILSVDIVRDVLNVMPLHWVAKLTGLDLKTRSNLRGSYLEVELMQMFQEIYSYVFLEGDTSHQMQLADLCQRHSSQLLRSIKSNTHKTSGVSRRASMFGTKSSGAGKASDLKSKLFATGYTESEVAEILFAIAVGVSAEYSQALIHVINLYLEPEHAAEAEKIKHLSTSGDAKSAEQLEGYVREALRLDPPVSGVLRSCTTDFTVEGSEFKKGDRYYLSIVHANMDSKKFHNPTKVDSTRPKEGYLIGDTALRCLGEDFIVKPIAQVLKVIFALPSIRRGPGVSGILNRSPVNTYGTRSWEYMDRKQRLTVWSQSMIVQYEGTATPDAAANGKQVNNKD